MKTPNGSALTMVIVQLNSRMLKDLRLPNAAPLLILT
jgi:hypothetical protein